MGKKRLKSTAEIAEAQQATARKYGITVLPGAPLTVDQEAMERNRLLIQRGYRAGRCWECERKGETQEIGLVKRKGVNGYVCPKHGGDDGELKPLVVALPAHRIGKPKKAQKSRPCGQEGCGHPRHNHKGGTGYCQQGSRCACEGFVDSALKIDYRVPTSPEPPSYKLRDTRQREAQLLRPIPGLTPPPNAREQVWLRQQKKA